MSKSKPWGIQETVSDSQQEAVVKALKEQARLLKLEADISEAGTEMLQNEGVPQELTDLISEKVSGNKETARELNFVANALDRPRNT